MEKRQILWAIVFGSMLAITGCGSDGGTAAGWRERPGTAAERRMRAGVPEAAGAPGTGGSDGGDFCTSLCAELRRRRGRL